MGFITTSRGGALTGRRFLAEVLEPRLFLHALLHDAKEPPPAVAAAAIIEPAGLHPDRFEPNNSIAAARNLGVVVSATFPDLSLHVPAPDNDYYGLFTPDNGPLTVRVDFAHAQGDVDLRLLNAAGGVLVTSAGTGNTETINWPAARNTVYYVHVYGYSGATNPNYQMSINGPAIPADRFEPNDSLQSARYFGLSTDRTENDLTVHAINNDDYYRLTAGATGTLNVSVAFSNALGNVELQLLNSSGGVLATSAGLGSVESVSAPVTKLGTYYVRVYGFQSISPDYDLTIDGPNIPPDQHEPNDTFAAATNFGGILSHNVNDLSIHAPGNDDFYRFSVYVTGPLTVTVAFTHALGDIDVQLLDASGAVVASAAGTGNTETINYPAFAGQTYGVRVHGHSGAINPYYNLTITGPPVPPDRYEPNDGFGAAVNLGTAGDHTLTRLSMHNQQDVDYFRLSAPANGNLAVTSPSSSPPGRLRIWLLDAAGETLAWGDGAASVAVAGGQTYYVEVRSTSGPVASYDLLIDGPEVPPDQSEPNDTLATASYFGAVGQRGRTFQSIHAPGNEDFYWFDTITPGVHPLTVTLNFNRDLGRVAVQLLDAAGVVLADSTNTASGEAINSTVSGGSRYYLRVYAPDGGLNPVYHLRANGPNLPPDRFEPNDNFATATNLGLVGDRTVEGLAAEAWPGYDFYRMTAAGNGTLSVAAYPEHPVEGMYVFMYDAAGNTLARSGTITVSAGQTYYAEVAGFGGMTVSRYRLVIDGPDMQPDRFEPNNTRAAATDFGLLGDRTEHNLNLHTPGDQDFYRVTSAAAGTMIVTLIFDHAQGDVDLQLLDPTGAVLAASTSTNNSEVVTRAVAPGETFYVRVYGHLGTISPIYSMIIDGPQLTGPAVVGRHVFYNRSALDLNDPAADPFDDFAIARDKPALLPGRTAGLINVSNYSRGINGLMVDLSGSRTGVPTADDVVIEFRNGTTWTRVPRPRGFLFRPGAGTGRSDRMSFVFDDNAIRNTWLRATVLANARTGLAAPDVFYVGHLAGETGDPARGGALAVTPVDFLRTRQALDAPYDDRYDFNRDRRVSPLDLAIVRSAAAERRSLVLLTAPAAGAMPAPPPASRQNDQDTDGGIAALLA